MNISWNMNLIDNEAIKQYKQTLLLKDIQQAAPMPDLHVGRTFPIGAVFCTKNVIYPSLVDKDIGCGMSLYQTDLDTNKNFTELSKKFNNFDDIKFDKNLYNYSHSDTLGTLGGGNHFAEFQIIHEVKDREEFEKLGLHESKCILVVHSGSRTLGKEIFDEHITKNGHNNSLKIDSPEYLDYFKKHNEACNWARANRELIAEKISILSNIKLHKKIDIWHNNISKKEFASDEELFIHRKGAAPSDQGPIIIPGSRGSYSYIVKPINSQETNCYSLAHGAGRAMSRSKANNYNRNNTDIKLHVNKWNGVVVCDEKSLYQEQKDAYKDIDMVIEELIDKNLIQVIAIYIPMLTIK